VHRTHRLTAPLLIATALALAGFPVLAATSTAEAVTAAAATNTVPVACTGTNSVAITSHTAAPSWATPGDSTVEKVTLVNCTDQAVVETVTFSGQWLLNGTPASLPGCGAPGEPTQVVVSFAPNQKVTTSFGLAVPETCEATSYAASATLGSGATNVFQLKIQPPNCLASVNYQPYKIPSQNRFYLSVTVSNVGRTSWSNWTAALTFAGDNSITTGWNATFTQTGNVLTATSMGWNGYVPPGASASFGADGTWTVLGESPPTRVTLSGHLCSLSFS